MASPELLLNKAALSHLSYHWFWGLRYSYALRPDHFGHTIEMRLSDETVLREMQSKQLRIAAYSPIIRFFYHLFNIENYVHDALLLSAHASYQNYRSYCVSLAIEETAESAYLTREKKTKISGVLNWVSKAIYNALYTNVIFEPALEIKAPANDNPSCNITDDMQPSLQALAINQPSGTSLAWDKVKSAYRKAALKTHPDKTNGLREAFEIVKKAYDALERRFFPGKFTDEPDAMDIIYVVTEIGKMTAEIKAATVKIEAAAVSARDAASSARAAATEAQHANEKIQARLVRVWNLIREREQQNAAKHGQTSSLAPIDGVPGKSPGHVLLELLKRPGFKLRGFAPSPPANTEATRTASELDSSSLPGPSFFKPAVAAEVDETTPDSCSAPGALH